VELDDLINETDIGPEGVPSEVDRPTFAPILCDMTATIRHARRRQQEPIRATST
jgi:hypothetical protein